VVGNGPDIFVFVPVASWRDTGGGHQGSLAARLIGISQLTLDDLKLVRRLTWQDTTI
jgi:hypothetical protein